MPARIDQLPTTAVALLVVSVLLASCSGPDDKQLGTLNSEERTDLCAYQYMVEGIASDGSVSATSNGSNVNALFPSEASCAATAFVASCQATIADAKRCYQDIGANICAVFMNMGPTSCAAINACVPPGSGGW